MSNGKRSHQNNQGGESHQGHPANNERNVKGNIHVHGEIQTHISPRLQEQQDSRNKRDDSRETRRFIVEIVGALLIAIYAGITVWQACLSRDLITLTKEQFYTSEQPYVWPTADPPIFTDEKPISWNVKYTNYGKSIALNVRHCGKAGYPITKGFPMPPTFQQFSTLQTPPNVIFHDRDYPDLHSVDGLLAGEGIFEYDDSSGHSYKSVYCFYLLATGAIQACSDYNYIKQTK
jgi:hypothetical protein